jgi:multidrug resistance efflux pump
VVTKILFDGGEAVVAGKALIELDPADAKIALAAANARLEFGGSARSTHRKQDHTEPKRSTRGGCA